MRAEAVVIVAKTGAADIALELLDNDKGNQVPRSMDETVRAKTAQMGIQYAVLVVCRVCSWVDIDRSWTFMFGEIRAALSVKRLNPADARKVIR